jgi:hypothetical protein
MGSLQEIWMDIPGAACAIPPYSYPFSFLWIERNCATPVCGHAWHELSSFSRQFYPITFGEFVLTAGRIDCCDRLPVNLFAELFDNGVKRKFVVVRIDFEPGVKAIADRRGRAVVAACDDHSIGAVWPKVLERDVKLVNERHATPFPPGCYLNIEKICYH